MVRLHALKSPSPALTLIHHSDPLFFLHHAVWPDTLSSGDGTERYVRQQMVDKIWYDWQNRDPVNAKSFFGGSVQHVETLDAYNQYPNGGPPYLSVSTCQFRLRDSS